MKSINMNTTSKLSRNYTNFLKIVSALMVALGHYSQQSIAHNWSSSPIWQVLADDGGRSAVAIFFFLSGYGLSESDNRQHLSFGDFVRRRFLKIYLPVLLVTAMWIAVEIAFLGKPLVWRTLPFDLFWGFDDGVLWFVQTLFVLYAAFFLHTDLMVRNHKLLAWIVAAFICLCWVRHIGISCFASIGFFASGVLFSRTRGLLPCLVFLFVGMCGCLTYVFFTKDYQGVWPHHAISFIVLAAVLLVYVGIAYIKGVGEKSCKIVAWCAAVTFDLYITHFKVLTTLVHYGSLRKEYRGGNCVIYMGLAFVVCVLFHYLRTYLLPTNKKKRQ